MWKLLSCVFGTVAVWGQLYVFPKTPPAEQAIQEYLGLSVEQIAAIRSNNLTFSSWVLERAARMEAVQFEVIAESEKNPILPGALGVRYAEMEATRRELFERNDKTIAENQALLNDAQNEKRHALEAQVLLYGPAIEAKRLNLLPNCYPDKLFRFANPSWACGNSDEAQYRRDATPFTFPTIQRYLSLTEIQVATLLDRGAIFARWVAERQIQIVTQQDSIAEASARSPLIPEELDVLYGQIEGLRREAEERTVREAEVNRTLLTEAQTAKLKLLEQALSAPELSYSANVFRLTPGPCLQVQEVLPRLLPFCGAGFTLVGIPAPNPAGNSASEGTRRKIR